MTVDTPGQAVATIGSPLIPASISIPGIPLLSGMLIKTNTSASRIRFAHTLRHVASPSEHVDTGAGSLPANLGFEWTVTDHLGVHVEALASQLHDQLYEKSRAFGGGEMADEEEPHRTVVQAGSVSREVDVGVAGVWKKL